MRQARETAQPETYQPAQAGRRHAGHGPAGNGLAQLVNESARGQNLQRMDAMMNGSAQSQALQRMARMANAGARTLPAGQGTVQAKIMIGTDEYAYDGVRKNLKNKNGSETVAPSDKNKSEQWAGDPWIRTYKDAAECKDHIEEKPVNCGLFRDMALWYDLPFKSGTPFVLGENHSTKVTPIMKESGRTGTLLHESFGVVPIGSKVSADKGTAGGLKKTSMESIVAKTLFGVQFHTAESMKPKAPPKHEVENSDDWAWNYSLSAPGKKGKDAQQRPFYKDGAGKRVIQGDSSTGYNSLNTLKRVAQQFDDEAGAYLRNVSVAGKDKAPIRLLKIKMAAWWADMQEISGLYADEKPENKDRREDLEISLDLARAALILDLTKAYGKEYQSEMAAKVTPLDDPLGAKISTFDERKQAAAAAGLEPEMVDSMAMRDLAMLTAIANSQKAGWGDHEMIAMGDVHAKTLGPALKERLKLTVITRDEFAATPYSTPAL